MHIMLHPRLHLGIWEVLHLAKQRFVLALGLLWTQPIRLHNTLSLQVQQFVGCLDRSIADIRNFTDDTSGLTPTEQVACEVDARTRIRQWASSRQGRNVWNLFGNFDGHKLNPVFKTEHRAETSNKIAWSGRLRVGEFQAFVVNNASVSLNALDTILGVSAEEVAQLFENSANVFLRHSGYVGHLSEGSWQFALTACYEQATSQDGIGVLATERASVENLLVQQFGLLFDCMADLLIFTPRFYLSVGCLQGTIRLVFILHLLRLLESPGFLGHISAATADRRARSAMKQITLDFTNTIRVVTSLFVTIEGSPFGLVTDQTIG